MKILGLTGYKQSGKNTFAAIIKEEAEKQGKTVKLVAYADKLKIAAARALGFDRPDADLIELMDSFKENGDIRIEYYGDEPNEFNGGSRGRQHDLSGREYLQFFGTEAGRNTFGYDFWVDQLTPHDQYSTNALYPGIDLLVVTDVRFDNEASRIDNLSGRLLQVFRPGHGGNDHHASEAGIKPELISWTVTNSGNTNDLRIPAKLILELMDV